MDARARVLALEAVLRVESAHGNVAQWASAAARAVRLADITGSIRFAGSELRPSEIAALVTAGSTPAGRSLDACNAVADYAVAIAHIAAIGRQRRGQPLIRVEEIVTLHAIATRRSTFERPGKWRTATAATQPSGVVPPPAWLVPRDVTALVERFANGPLPERPTLLWLADFHARFARIHPFATANGRVARLCLSLLLTRLHCPPFIIRPGEGPRFARTLDRATAGDLWPSALFFGRSILKTMDEFGRARELPGLTLLTLSEIAGEGERAALYKAAQRGRLRTIRKGTSVFTSKIWLDEYRSSRAAAGRPRAIRPPT